MVCGEVNFTQTVLTACYSFESLQAPGLEIEFSYMSTLLYFGTVRGLGTRQKCRHLLFKTLIVII